MMPEKPRLLGKLTLILVLLLSVISALPFAITYTTTREALMEQLRDQLRSTASVLAAQIDGGTMAGLEPGDEDSPEYRSIHRRLRLAQEADHGIKYVYTMRLRGRDVEFVVDADYGVRSDGAEIGRPYPEGTGLKDLMDGFEKPSADRAFTSDEWGTVLSGYSPVRDSTGASVGLVGIDMEGREAKSRLNSIAFTNFILVLLVVLLGVSVVMTALHVLVVRDLYRIIGAASRGEPSGVEREDEIGRLAKLLDAKLPSERR